MRNRILGWIKYTLAVLMIAAGISAMESFAGEPWAHIEEDWELELGQPDWQTNSPQITIYLTPDQHEPDRYFELQLNHAADADFLGGGFRVAAVSNEETMDQALSDTRAVLSTENDLIKWTSVMAVRNSEVLFAIKDGSGHEWGEFGGPEYLVRMPNDGLKDLKDYTPHRSIADVDVGYGGNRVTSLTLKRVRVFREDGSSVTVEANLRAD